MDARSIGLEQSLADLWEEVKRANPPGIDPRGGAA